MKVDVSKNKALKQFLCVFVAILSVRLTIFLVSTSDQVIKHVDEQKTTVIEDNVHGPMRVPTYFLEFINTLEFQRLRNVKQMGITYSVFSGAMHTRFEHCIGTGYLSYTLLETLEKNSGVQIGGMLKKCVVIAGLLHDLGHGPFSHVWEHIIHSGEDHTWTHEQSSCDMFVQLVEANNITLWDTEEGHNYSIELIQALIVGDTTKLEQLLPNEMNFLSEIVNNKFCNIDVDKVDYLLRDGYHLKNSLEIKEDFAKFLDGSKIITDSKNDTTHIGFRIQDYPLICKMFEYRANIHTKIIQDTRTKGAELMLVDAFLEAEHSGFTFKNQKLSLIQSNAKLFTQFDDTIKKFIEMSDDPRLEQAQSLFRRIKLSRFYDVIWESSRFIDVNILNNQFGNYFIIKHEKVPDPEVPANIVLFDNRGVVNSRKPYKSLSHESYIIYSKSENTDINRKAKIFMKTSKLIYY